MINLTMNVLALLFWILVIVTIWALLPASVRIAVIKKMCGAMSHLRSLWLEVKDQVKEEKAKKGL